MSGLKVVHVVPAISEESSGPSYSVSRLCRALRRSGDDVTLASLDWAPGTSKLPYELRFPIGPLARRIGSSPALRRWLQNQTNAGSIDIIHNHGMWQMNSLYPGWVARGGKCKLIVSPRGAFSEWAMAHGSYAKNLFWPLLQRPSFRSAACFHATAESEYEGIRRLGFTQPVAIIPNGIDAPDPVPACAREQPVRTLLFLGRIHRKKGLDLLLPAWASLHHRFPDWRLVIVGGDAGYGDSSGYLEQMRMLAHKLGAARVEFVGELRGADKWRAYHEAALFILPTYSENFGLAVAEALISGIPAIVTRGAPWSGLESHGAGWWADVSLQGLTEAMSDALSCSSKQLAAMGKHGRQWMLEDFSWCDIGKKMSLTYRWLNGQLDKCPSWIRAD